MFRRRVTNGESAYISFEFRNGDLKYYHNNAEKGPSRQPQHDIPPDFSKPPPRRGNTPATAAPTSPLAAPVTPAVAKEQLLASTPAGAGVVTRRAAKKRKGTSPPGQDHVPHPTTSPEAARGAAEINCLQVSLLSLTDHERVHGVCSNQDTPVCDDGGDDEDEGDDDDDEDEEEVEVESDHFSRNIFSALAPPTTLNATTNTDKAAPTTLDATTNTDTAAPTTLDAATHTDTSAPTHLCYDCVDYIDSEMGVINLCNRCIEFIKSEHGDTFCSV